jgi:hypothetical protein
MQDKNDVIIRPEKVTEINIVNKVYCHFSKLRNEKVKVTDRILINNLIGALNDAQQINRLDIRTNVNNGFFEIGFEIGGEAYSYDILYTVYDGVVIRNLENGDCLRNDFLEILVYKLFL